MATKKKAGKNPVAKKNPVKNDPPKPPVDAAESTANFYRKQYHKEREHRFSNDERRIIATALEMRCRTLAKLRDECQTAFGKQELSNAYNATNALSCRIMGMPHPVAPVAPTVDSGTVDKLEAGEWDWNVTITNEPNWG